MFMFVCDVPDVLKIIRIIKIVITLIKIVVPIILIVTAMIDLMKNITNSNGEINTTLQSFVRKAIAAIIVFLIPTFVNVILNVVSNKNNFVACYNNATEERIEQLYVSRMEALINYAEDNADRASYNQASKYINEIKNKEIRENYRDRLEEVKEEIVEEEQKEVERKKNKLDEGLNNPPTVPGGVPVDVQGYGYITAKGPDNVTQRDFLNVARDTWHQVVNGNFRYGNGTYVPPQGGYLDCSAYVTWALHNYGIHINPSHYQITTAVMVGMNWESLGFERIAIGTTEDITNKVRPGDIIVRYGYHCKANGSCLTEGHTNIIGSVTDGNILVFDAGSDDSVAHGKYPNGFPTLVTNFLKSADGRPGFIIRMKKR